MASIEDFIVKQLVSAQPGDNVWEVARKMQEAAVGAVVVLDGEKLAGLFSERDLLTRIVAEGRNPATTSVGEVATSDVVTVTADSSIRRCAEAFRSHRVRHLPVVEGTRPVGIIAARDFFERVSGELEGLIERLRYDEQLEANLDPYDHFGGSYGR